MGPSFMNIWTCGNSLQSWSLNAWSRIKNVNSASIWVIFWIFRRDPINFLSQLETIDETWLYHYEPDIKEQSIKWGHSGSPRPTPKNPTVKIIYKSSGCLDVLGIKTASSLLIFFQRAKESRRSITHLCWCNSRTFWRIEAAGSSQCGSCSCTKMPRFTGHLRPRRKWHTRDPSFLITHPNLQNWPPSTTILPCWKTYWNFTIIRPLQSSLLPQRSGWTEKFLNFFECLANVRETG